MQKNICIVGLGYVGLTLAVHAAKNGYRVFGVEILDETYEVLSKGKCHFHEPGIEELLKSLLNKNLFISKKIPSNEKMDIFIVTVGTPLAPELPKKPNIDILDRAINSFKSFINEDSLILLRSTIPVGTTRKIEQSLLKELRLKSVNISFCPERTAEGKALVELRSLPQIISGNNKKSLMMARLFFEPLTDEIVNSASLEEAELIKLLNNTYRDACFAISNTFNEIAQSFNVDGNGAIERANFHYPRSDIPMPGFVAGPCLEKDAYILASNVENSRLKTFLLSIRSANENVEDHLSRSLVDLLKKDKFKKIIISGLAFKGVPQTNDMRGSSSIKILEKLKSFKENIVVHDFMNSKDQINSIISFDALEPDGFTNKNKELYDLIIIMNNNPQYKKIETQQFIQSQIDNGSKVLDVWNVMELENQLTITNFFIGEMG